MAQMAQMAQMRKWLINGSNGSFWNQMKIVYRKVREKNQRGYKSHFH